MIAKIKEAAPEIAEKKELPEKFDITTFYEQLKAARKLGPLKGVFQMMGMSNVPKEIAEEGEKKMDDYASIIASMTKSERENPDLLRKSPGRIERISKGCGVKPESIRAFLSQFEKMRKLYDQLQKNKGMQKQLEKYFKGGKPA